MALLPQFFQNDFCSVLLIAKIPIFVFVILIRCFYKVLVYFQPNAIPSVCAAVFSPKRLSRKMSKCVSSNKFRAHWNSEEMIKDEFNFILRRYKSAMSKFQDVFTWICVASNRYHMHKLDHNLRYHKYVAFPRYAHADVLLEFDAVWSVLCKRYIHTECFPCVHWYAPSNERVGENSYRNSCKLNSKTRIPKWKITIAKLKFYSYQIALFLYVLNGVSSSCQHLQNPFHKFHIWPVPWA